MVGSIIAPILPSSPSFLTLLVIWLLLVTLSYFVPLQLLLLNKRKEREKEEEEEENEEENEKEKEKEKEKNWEGQKEIRAASDSFRFFSLSIPH